jgi:gas vesicle protein
MSLFYQSKNGADSMEPETTNPDVEKAVHVALGIPAAVADVVNDAVERWTNSSQRDKDLKVLRQQLDKALAVAEKKGVEVRKQLPNQVERSLKVVEQRGDEVRKQAVEQARVTRERVEPTLRKVGSEAKSRGKKVSDTTQEQITRVREQLTS